MKKIFNVVVVSLLLFYSSYAQVARDIKRDDNGIQNSRENYDDLLKDFYKLFTEPGLMNRGKSHIYKGKYLEAIQFPVGGIGAGCIQYDGNAVPRYWQIFNNMTHDFIPNSFFSIRVKRDEKIWVKALQTESVGPFEKMNSLNCVNEFPFLRYNFTDSIPVNVELEVYNPFIPLNLKDSSIPAVFYTITIDNPTEEEIEISLLASQQNAVGFSKVPKINTGDSFAERYQMSLERDIVKHNSSPFYGGNINSIKSGRGYKGLFMESAAKKEDEHYGQMALLLVDETHEIDCVEGVASWKDLLELHDGFKKTGRLKEVKNTPASMQQETWSGALNARLTLSPGEKKKVNLVLVWYFPNGKNGGHLDNWDSWGKGDWEGNGNFYVNDWRDIYDLADYTSRNHSQLYQDSKLFYQSLYATNLPYWLLNRLSSQLAILKSRTLFRDKQGYVGLWEGCGAGDGSCAGNCNHVWHYAQAHARLFPSLARVIRSQAFDYMKDNGQIPYRQPAGESAFDGQCGDILGAYREYLLSTDDSWIKKHYPSIKKAINYLIQGWDEDEDGWLTGHMHTTYDCSMSGNPSFLGSLYLAALSAGKEIAIINQDDNFARKLKDIADKSVKLQNQELWNGRYYIQKPDTISPASDYATGCHSDQLIGQWWADQLGLESLYPDHRVLSATEAVLRYNFKSNLKNHHQKPREFAKPEEAGFVVTTWPKGDRPVNAPVYSDEIWSVYEFTIGASLLRNFKTREALMVLKAGADRYDGQRKDGYQGAWGNFGFSGNPFGDDECGQFYSRSLANWSIILAMQGFYYDGPKGIIGFSPTWMPENHISFFSTAKAWGNYKQRLSPDSNIYIIDIKYGELKLNKLYISAVDSSLKGEIIVSVNGDLIDFNHSYTGNKIQLNLDDVELLRGDRLKVLIE